MYIQGTNRTQNIFVYGYKNYAPIDRFVNTNYKYILNPIQVPSKTIYISMYSWGIKGFDTP